MKILIVEQNIEERENIIKTLNKFGLEDFIIESVASTALWRAQNHPFDMLITDLKISKYNDLKAREKEGLELLENLSYMKRIMPTIIYSNTKLEEEEIQRLNDLGYIFEQVYRENFETILPEFTEKVEKMDHYQKIKQLRDIKRTKK